MEPLEEDFGVLTNDTIATTYRSGMGVLNVSPHLDNDYIIFLNNFQLFYKFE